VVSTSPLETPMLETTATLLLSFATSNLMLLLITTTLKLICLTKLLAAAAE
jgi:hypothetical protein